jgi:hypothetical protein
LTGRSQSVEISVRCGPADQLKPVEALSPAPVMALLKAGDGVVFAG